MVKQAMVDAVTYLVSLLVVIFVAVSITVARGKMKSNYIKDKHCTDWEDTERAFVALAVTVVAWTAVGILSIGCAIKVPPMLLNPEYYIVEKLLYTFSQM